jgi:hypothetical protein
MVGRGPPGPPDAGPPAGGGFFSLAIRALAGPHALTTTSFTARYVAATSMAAWAASASRSSASGPAPRIGGWKVPGLRPASGTPKVNSVGLLDRRAQANRRNQLRSGTPADGSGVAAGVGAVAAGAVGQADPGGRPTAVARPAGTGQPQRAQDAPLRAVAVRPRGDGGLHAGVGQLPEPGGEHLAGSDAAGFGRAAPTKAWGDHGLVRGGSPAVEQEPDAVSLGLQAQASPGSAAGAPPPGWWIGRLHGHAGAPAKGEIYGHERAK